MSSGDCGQIPQSPQMERGSSTVDGGQSKPKVKRAKNGRTVCVTQSHTHRWSQKRVTHRHKMGGARFDMSAPDIRDKPERAPNNEQEDEMILCTIPNGVADRVADEWM